MKMQNLLAARRRVFLLISLAVLIPVFSANTYAQFGNTISGHIFGAQREPLGDINVELLDSYSRFIGRARTNGSGRYIFTGLGSGRFVIRVLSSGTDYEEQEQEVEIVNFAVRSSNGDSRPSGFSNEQKDFYLRPRRRGELGVTGTIFAQEVPENAKKLYEKGVAELGDKKEKEGLGNLKSAIEAFPKYYAALERLGTEYVRLGHFEAAEILLTLAVDVNPRGYKSWYGLAYSLYSLKKNTEAGAAIQKAIEMNQYSAEAFLLSGVLKRQNKQFDESEKQLVKAKELSKGTMPLVNWHLALLYGYDLKRYRDAARELKLFLKAQPDAKDGEKIRALIKEFEDKAQTAG
ncbi:MAG TPA: tetratricopeptide repeat protein [Pyrinomonadaceae bacterium]|jgi:tetratricopeptide (TPR) repeat protein